jgi:hypothetical protein
MRRTLPLLPLLAFLALPVPEAAAQFGRAAPRAQQAPAVRPPPPALPGLQSRRAPEPIPADPTQNLAPNAALFDAINRGDLPAAREAVARGADTEARNVLGLTAVDAAVDQGRTEIMFYLLSVRSGSRGGPAEEAPAAPPPPPQRSARRVAEPPAPRRAAAEAAAPAAVSNPRLWAGDGGSASPEIGFLGFDAGRPAGAVPPAEARPARPSRAGRG